jgi:hypothetical protein
MSTAAEFRAAVETMDVERMKACLADDVVFYSPVAFKGYHSKLVVSTLLEHVSQVFENFIYVDDIEQGTSHMLRFRANVGELEIEGVDLLDLGDDGLIKTFTVMVRPLKSAIALAQAMGARIEADGGIPHDPGASSDS